MTTLAEFMIIAGADNRPPMLDKTMYDSWKSQNGETRKKKYEELSASEKLQADCDLKATNIGETMYQYYWIFTQLINDMHIINMTMRHVQVNTKFLNSLPPEWSKFVMDVKLARDLHTTNYDQLYSYLQQHEAHANETRLLRLAVHVFNQGDDPIACLNKASYAGARNKGNATSSGANNASGQARVVKCYNCQGEGHMARQCTQPKRPRNATWFKEKEMLAKAHESGQVLDEEQLAFLADPGITDCPDV
ncbi:retrovirus-related pol polyprotein from transposon TNT 1-94 [Tanacetum coccineum]